MPKGPKGEKRPADTNACAVHVAKIATGELEDDRYETPNRRKSGMAGAEARIKRLSDEEKSRIARLAATTRWRKENTMSTLFDTVADELFPTQGARAVDVKFSIGGYSGISAEELLIQIQEANRQISDGTAVQIDDIDADLTAFA